MTHAPRLLDDEGKASMATAIMMSHHGFRRDLAWLERALASGQGSDPGRAALLAQEWARFRATLHGHHQAEDAGLFPSLAKEHPDVAEVIARLEADHRRIDPLLEAGDRAFVALGAESGAAHAVVVELGTLLGPHLATEEVHLVPHLRDARTFPPIGTDAEADLYAQGFAWASYGIAAEVVAGVDEMLPTALLARLPAARAAFAERWTRIYGEAHGGSARTAIPEDDAPVARAFEGLFGRL